MIGNSIFIALLIAHLKAYKEHYITIGTSFVITYTIKKLIKILDGDIADCFALGGYAMTITSVMKLLAVLRHAGVGEPEEGHEIIGGIFGDLVDKFIKH